MPDDRLTSIPLYRNVWPERPSINVYVAEVQQSCPGRNAVRIAIETRNVDSIGIWLSLDEAEALGEALTAAAARHRAEIAAWGQVPA